MAGYRLLRSRMLPELKSVIHHAMLSSGLSILAPDLKLMDIDATDDDATLEQKVEKHLNVAEPRLVERLLAAAVTIAFERSGHNQVRTAAALGISRNELRTRLAHLGVIPPRTSRKVDDPDDV